MTDRSTHFLRIHVHANVHVAHTQESRRNESEIRLDREVNSLRTHVEQTKNDIIKYSMGFLVSISAVGLGLIRLLI